MYSYEDRMRAVKLYIKLGKRIRATIVQLGYPTKNALKNWYRECALAEFPEISGIGHGRSLTGASASVSSGADHRQKVQQPYVWSRFCKASGLIRHRDLKQ